MSSISNHIKTRISQLPVDPGVYIIKSATGSIIYIGKAVNLRNRVRSYFVKNPSNDHFAAHVLKDKARDITWIVTSNESEALILEANLIRKHHPRYNVDLKDDKHFPYIKLTTSELFPRIVITRKVGSGKDKYFGPYTNAGAMRRTIDIIYKIFRIRDCKLKFPLKRSERPCLTYHIGRCDAPCAGLCSQKQYSVLTDEVQLLLKGKNTELLKNLKNNMQKASDSQNFEDAAKIRDQIGNISAVLEKQKMDFGSDKISRDLITVARTGKIGCALVFQIREGVVIDKKSYELTCPLEQDENELITAFIKSFYNEDSFIPRELIMSHDPIEDNLNVVLSNWRSGPVLMTVPQKGMKKRQIKLAQANAQMNIAEYTANYEKKQRINFAVSSLQEDLHLSKLPRLIEAIDISHLGGTDTVASLVVFNNGLSAKSKYRKYIIKTVENIDDVACIREVMTRRVKRLIEEKKEFPDLFLIDGGKGQLNAAAKVLDTYGVKNQEIIGLAKRLEEVFKPGHKDPFFIPRTSASLKLIQQVRNEAHRFAITFQRSKRKKHITKTWLDSIPGIGPKTRQKLLKEFKSPAKVKSADLKPLMECVGPKVAELIMSFRKTYSP